MNIDTEGLQRAARQATDAADSLRKSTGEIDEAMRKLAQYFEQGYGSPIFELIELLETIRPEQLNENTYRPKSFYLIGQRVIYYKEICTIKNDVNNFDDRNILIRRLSPDGHYYESLVDIQNIKPLPGGQL